MTTSIPRSKTWSAAQRLVAEFPTVPPREIASTLIDARRAVDLFGLDADAELDMAETIARERLIQRVREHAYHPRLDPETHSRRKTP